MLRTHRVDISALKEIVDWPRTQLCYIRTKFQAADIFTKCLSAQLWGAALKMLSLFPDLKDVCRPDLIEMLENQKSEHSRCDEDQTPK